MTVRLRCSDVQKRKGNTSFGPDQTHIKNNDCSYSRLLPSPRPVVIAVPWAQIGKDGLLDNYLRTRREGRREKAREGPMGQDKPHLALLALWASIPRNTILWGCVFPEDITQWAGVSLGMVINCTHCTMVAILDKHNNFLYILEAWSKETQQVELLLVSNEC
ncbi:hypothetical protein BS17DRAFT_805908 [Gyrodon lividus]|nr:hypothetical protein BS17DRAFT_805908 [Gyrodon lividus]